MFLALPGETAKLQQHLNLLREQYVKLQQRHSDLEQKYTRAIATSGNASADHFVSRLVRMVADLYDKSLYRFVELFIGACLRLVNSLPKRVCVPMWDVRMCGFTVSNGCN